LQPSRRAAGHPIHTQTGTRWEDDSARHCQAGCRGARFSGESGEEIVVGVNAFTGEQEIEVLPNRMVSYPYDPEKRAEAEVKQVKKLIKVREQRDNHKVETILAQLQEAARDDKVNLMPLTIEAVRAYSTVGEICGILKEVFGEYSGYGTL